MLRLYSTIVAVAERISEAADAVVTALQEGWMEQEDAFTGRLLGRIEEALREFQSKGITWRAKSLTSKIRNSEESKFGADFIGVIDIQIPGYEVRKGFLAQAKLLGNSQRGDWWLTSGGWTKFAEQCKRMLKISPESYVFLYSRNGIRIVPAIAVAALATQAEWPRRRMIEGSGLVDLLYSRGIRRFFEDHLASFVGDQRISGPDLDSLKSLMEQGQVRRLLYLTARGG